MCKTPDTDSAPARGDKSVPVPMAVDLPMAADLPTAVVAVDAGGDDR